MRNFLFSHLLWLVLFLPPILTQNSEACPSEQEILPCSCKMRASSILISCRYVTATELKVILGVLVHRNLTIIEEVMLEDNFLPELSPEIFENSPQIHRFFLWNNGIQHVANNSLDPLSLGLRELHIREPHLTDIPRNLFISMVQLQKLTVENTPLTEFPELNFCHSLVEVYLDGTRITYLRSHSLFDLQDLRIIELKNSWLTYFSYESLHNLPNLEILNFTGNYISTLNSSGWKSLPKLEAIDLRDNVIREIKSWVDCFASLKFLRTLHLDRNRLQSFNVKLLIILPLLKELTLSSNDIEALEHEIYQTDRFSEIQELNLSFNKLKRIDAQIFYRTPRLKILRLNGNPLESSFEFQSILNLTDVKVLELDLCEIETLTIPKQMGHYSLEKLSLQSNFLSELPLHTLKGMFSLTELDLSRNNLTSFIFNNAKQLSSTRRNLSEREEYVTWKFPALRRMDLSYNGITELPSDFLMQFPSICSISLHQNNLTGIAISSLGNLRNLVYLDVSHNNLQGTTDEFCKQFDKLETLRISANNLRGISLVGCHKLRALDLSHNNVKHLPANTFHSNWMLQVLNISSNYLRVVPDLGKLHQLTKVTLARNNIERLQPNDFMSNVNLETVDLSNNLIYEIPQGYFNSCKRLENVELSHNRILSLAAYSFTPVGGPYVLDLSFNQISIIETGFFSHFRNLRNLNLSHNNLTTVNFLDAANLDNIRVLNIDSNSLKNISNLSIQEMGSLVELNLSNNSIATVEALQFSNSRSLMRVNLSRNNIQHLPPNAFSSLPNLEELLLTNNELRNIETSTFNDLVSLDYLGLDRNLIESIDPKAFGGLFLVRILNISNNRISQLDNAGVSNLYSLEGLDVSNNYITELNEKNLRRLQRLVYLNLDENNITYVSENFLRHQPLLHTLSLRRNNLRNLTDKFLVPGNLRHMDLNENPLKCDCGLLKVFEKLKPLRSYSPDVPPEMHLKLSSSINGKNRGPLVGRAINDPFNCPAINTSRPAQCDVYAETLKEQTNSLSLRKNHSTIAGHSNELTFLEDTSLLSDITNNVSTIYAKIQKSCNSTAQNSSSNSDTSTSPSSYLHSLFTNSNKTYQFLQSRLGLNLLPAVINTGAWISNLISKFFSNTPLMPSDVLPINQIGGELLQSELLPGLTPAQLLEIYNHLNLSLLSNLSNLNNSKYYSDPAHHTANQQMFEIPNIPDGQQLPSSTSHVTGTKNRTRYSPLVKAVKLLNNANSSFVPLPYLTIHNSSAGEHLTTQLNQGWSPLVSCGNLCNRSFNATQPAYVKKHDSAGNKTDSSQQNKRDELPVISASGSSEEIETDTAYALLIGNTEGELTPQQANYGMQELKNTSESLTSTSEVFRLKKIHTELTNESHGFLEEPTLMISNPALSSDVSLLSFKEKNLKSDESTERTNGNSFDHSSFSEHANPRTEIATTSILREEMEEDEAPSIPEFIVKGEVIPVHNDWIYSLNAKKLNVHDSMENRATMGNIDHRKAFYSDDIDDMTEDFSTIDIVLSNSANDVNRIPVLNLSRIVYLTLILMFH